MFQKDPCLRWIEWIVTIVTTCFLSPFALTGLLTGSDDLRLAHLSKAEDLALEFLFGPYGFELRFAIGGLLGLAGLWILTVASPESMRRKPLRLTPLAACIVFGTWVALQLMSSVSLADLRKRPLSSICWLVLLTGPIVVSFRRLYLALRPA